MNNGYHKEKYKTWNGKRVPGQPFSGMLEPPGIIWSYGSVRPFIFDTKLILQLGKDKVSLQKTCGTTNNS